MNEQGFAGWLKKKGKKAHVVTRQIAGVNAFAGYLRNQRGKDLTAVRPADIDAYVAAIEQKKRSAKGLLYVLMHYFAFAGNQPLRDHAAALRETRTRKSRRVFALKEFLGIHPDHVVRLAHAGIKNVQDMLAAGKTKAQRQALSRRLDIPEAAILELVKLSDLTRLGYVKAKLTRLYYNAGLDAPHKIAAFTPKALHAFFVKFVRESGWDGMVPNPKDLVGNVAAARKLKPLVEE